VVGCIVVLAPACSAPTSESLGKHSARRAGSGAARPVRPVSRNRPGRSTCGPAPAGPVATLSPLDDRSGGASGERPLLECVINISEGTRLDVVETIGRAAGRELLDVHTDADHNRSVLTVVGEEAARAVAAATVLTLDLRHHQGVHPRIGVLDVVPFVPLGTSTMADAISARDRFATWAGETLGLPCFLYGPERTLPGVRRQAWSDLAPSTGPDRPHPSAGAAAVGARPVLVAYNVWLVEPDLELARGIARDLRAPAVRTLGLVVGDEVQVSMNLIDPLTVGPADVYDQVAERAAVHRAELVGLVPRRVLDAAAADRWSELDLAPDRTIEARLEARGLLGAEPLV
jgi:glutamate formiminotransferase / 5-formyltetrahydrofolate cyclo-ligase